MLYLQVESLLCKQVPQKAEKLVAIFATSILMIGKKKEEKLEWKLCI